MKRQAATNKEYEPNEYGWRRLVGDVDFPSSPEEISKVPDKTEGINKKKKYLARLKGSFSCLDRTITENVAAGKQYEAKVKIKSKCEEGFFAASIIFLNEKGKALQYPTSQSYVRLSSQQRESVLSVLSEPAPEGATGVRLVLTSVRLPPEEFVQIKNVVFEEIRE